MKLRKFVDGQGQGKNMFAYQTGVSTTGGNLEVCVMNLLSVLALVTFFKCFFMRIDPLSVHFMPRFFGPPFDHCAADDVAFFSFTHMSISENKKHSSSCHAWQSFPTFIVPWRRSFPNLGVLASGYSHGHIHKPIKVQPMPVLHAKAKFFRNIGKQFLFAFPFNIPVSGFRGY